MSEGRTIPGIGDYKVIRETGGAVPTPIVAYENGEDLMVSPVLFDTIVALLERAIETTADLALKGIANLTTPIRLNHLDTNVKPPPFDVVSNTPETVDVTCVDCEKKIDPPLDAYQFAYYAARNMKDRIVRPLCKPCYLEHQKGRRKP